MRNWLVVLIAILTLTACGGGAKEGASEALTDAGSNDNARESISDQSSSDSDTSDPGVGFDNTNAIGSLPEGFPSNFPLPENAEITADFSFPEDGDFQLLMDYPSSLEEAAAYFSDSLPPAGWTILSEEEITIDTGRSLRLEIGSDNFDGHVLILEGDQGVGIQVQLTGESSKDDTFIEDHEGEILTLGDRANGLPVDFPYPGEFSFVDVPQDLTAMGYRVAFTFDGPAEEAISLLEEILFASGWEVLFTFEDEISGFYELEITNPNFDFEGTISLTDSPGSVGLEAFDGTLIAIHEGFAEDG